MGSFTVKITIKQDGNTTTECKSIGQTISEAANSMSVAIKALKLEYRDMLEFHFPDSTENSEKRHTRPEIITKRKFNVCN